MRKFWSILIAAAIMALGLGTLPVRAAGATLYLSPASKTVTQGSIFAVAVRVSTSEAVNAVQANLTYPADKLDYVSVSDAGSAFNVQGPTSGGGGSVKIARGTTGSVSGDRLVATVNFKVKQSSGTAAVTFASGSAVVRTSDSTNVLTGTTGGNYAMTPIPTHPATPAAPADTTAPALSNVKVANVGFKSAVISWQTDEPATSVVEFGLDTQYGLAATDNGLVKDHSLTVSSVLLTPGLSYHFRVKSSDAAGNGATGTDATFNTKGMPITITVLIATNNKPVKGVKVSLVANNQTATTDTNGQVSFDSATPGNQAVAVTVGGKQQVSTIMVNDPTADELKAGTAAPQSFTVKVAPAGVSYWWWIASGLLAVILAAAGAWWYRRRRSGPPPPAKLATPTPTPEPPLVPPTPMPITAEPPMGPALPSAPGETIEPIAPADNTQPHQP